MRIFSHNKSALLNKFCLATACAITLALSGCGSSKGSPGTTSTPSSGISTVSSAQNSSTASLPSIAEMTPNENAHWKRVKAIQNDLAYALDIHEDELCHELGSLSCFDQVHLSALGGNEPFILTQYEPVETPTATSAVVTERVVLAACSNKVDIDRQNTPTVFTEYDLSIMSQPANNDYLLAVDQQNTKLYQRLLVRDPTQEELMLLQTLTQDTEGNAISNVDVAKLSCFTIATSSEFIFL